MNRISHFALLLLFLFSCSPKPVVFESSSQQDQELVDIAAELKLNKKIDSLVSILTMEQKVDLVVGVGMNFPGFSQSETKEKVQGAAGNTGAITELGIPSIVLADGPAGLRISPTRIGDNNTYYCTAFPIATLLASTWDKDLVEEVGMAMGEEVKEYGADVLLGPGMNIHRNPLCGRNFEYFSEDPYLSGHMAAAIVNGIESKGVGTSIKHFAVNNQETNRMMINAMVDERTLREIYLRGFEIVVKESQPWTVMSSYNKINGTYAPQNHDLLQTILRDEWGFKGMVMTDWLAGDDPVAMVHAGNDLLMPGTPQQKESIITGMKDGNLDENVLNANVKRVLKVVFQSRSAKGYKYSNSPDLPGHAAVARKAAAEGIVLLKNNGVLPIKPAGLRIAAYGNASYEFIAGGTGSGDVNEAYTISLVEGLENINLPVDGECRMAYKSFMEEAKANQPKKRFFFAPTPPIPQMPISKIDVVTKAINTDIALITIGRNSGEFQDRDLENDFYLSDTEKEMIITVSKAYHAQGKKVILLMNVGNVIETDSWKDHVDAIVLAWQGGQEAGNALVDVLTGRVNPSGKLPTTFTNVYDDYPSADFFPGEEIPRGKEKMLGPISAGKESEVEYKEGIYVGYRHFSTFDKETSFPFGYGLSYTNFKYSDPELNTNVFNGKMVLSLKVTNIGEVSGKEVVQVYIAAPGETMDKPAFELKDFAKTKLLNPGESQSIIFKINEKDLASFDIERSAWMIEKGAYKIKIGSSSENMKLQLPFRVPSNIEVEKVHRVLLPKSIKPEIGINEENSKFNKVDNILWASPKGHDLTMDIYTPNTGKNSYPVIVMFHGGGWLINNETIMDEPSKYLASNEYVVCNVNYRLLGNLNNSVKMNEIVEDAFGAVLWVKAHISKYGGDPSQVIVTGDSAGGHLAMMIVGQGQQLSSEGFTSGKYNFNPSWMPENKNPEQIAAENGLSIHAAIISYGAFDIYNSVIKGGYEKTSNFFWTMGGAEARGLFGQDVFVEKHPEPYKAVSPIYNIPSSSDKKLPPMLFTVGSEDNLTTPASIVDFISKLKAAGHSNIDYWVHQGRPHAFLDSGSNEFLGTKFEKDGVPALKKMVSFLNNIFYPGKSDQEVD